MRPVSEAPTISDIRTAVSVIHLAVHDTDHSDPVAVADAHITLARARHTSPSPVDRWLTSYLDYDTWEHGPHAVINAVDELARNFKLPPQHRQGLPDGKQGTLF